MRRMIVRASSDRQPCELPLHESANVQDPRQTFWMAFPSLLGTKPSQQPPPDQCFAEFPRQLAQQSAFFGKARRASTLHRPTSGITAEVAITKSARGSEPEAKPSPTGL